jgi:hypothetical protein
MRGSRLGAVLANGIAQVPLTLPPGAQAHYVAACSGSPRCSELHPCSFPSATTWIPPLAAVVAQSSVDWRLHSRLSSSLPSRPPTGAPPKWLLTARPALSSGLISTRAVGAGPRHCSKSSSSCGCEEREDVRRVEKSVRRSGGASKDRSVARLGC